MFKYIKGRGNLSFGSVKGPTDEFYGFIKSRKRSIFVTDKACERDTFINRIEIEGIRKVYPAVS